MSDNTQSYEIMFLLDAGNPDFNAASEPARVALEKNEAQILSIKPWDERRLAYEIHGRRRGLYVLAYFKAPTPRLAEIERDCMLDERILRIMIIRRDDLTEEIINAETPATSSARRAAVRQAEEDATKAREAAAAGAVPESRRGPAEETDLAGVDLDAAEEGPDEDNPGADKD